MENSSADAHRAVKDSPIYKQVPADEPYSAKDRNFGHEESYGPDGLTPRDIRVERELFPNTGHARLNSEHYDDVSVQTFGDDVPQPIQRFEDVSLGPVITNNRGLSQLHTMTPIQKYALPIIMEGRDLMACVETGSGKTYAYLFPIVAKLSRHHTPASSRKVSPACVILAPNRELAMGIEHQARKWTYRSHLKSCVVYGGAPVSEQVRQLARGCDILVATPGRMVDLLERGKVSLSQVTHLCLDETDRLLDMGFEAQIRRIVEELDMPAAGLRQTLLFSATFSKEVERLAHDLLHDYIFLRVGRASSTSAVLDQQMCRVDEGDKRATLIDVLSAVEGLTIVHVSTKQRAAELDEFLARIGLPSTCIHGDRSQQEREEALRLFREGHTPILVATDLAGHGVNIPRASHVINYDLPSDIDTYIYRIRRAGHAAVRGSATSFFNATNAALAGALVELLQQTGQEVPAWLRQYAVDTNRSTSGSYGYHRRGGRRGYSARPRGRDAERPPSDAQNNNAGGSERYSPDSGSNSAHYSGGSLNGGSNREHWW